MDMWRELHVSRCLAVAAVASSHMYRYLHYLIVEFAFLIEFYVVCN